MADGISTDRKYIRQSFRGETAAKPAPGGRDSVFPTTALGAPAQGVPKTPTSIPFREQSRRAMRRAFHAK